MTIFQTCTVYLICTFLFRPIFCVFFKILTNSWGPVTFLSKKFPSVKDKGGYLCLNPDWLVRFPPSRVADIIEILGKVGREQELTGSRQVVLSAFQHG